MKTVLYFTISTKHNSKEVELEIEIQNSPLNNYIVEITKDNLKLANVQFEYLRKGFVASYLSTPIRNLEHLLSMSNIKIAYSERVNASNKFYDDRLKTLKSNLVGKTFIPTNSIFNLYGVEFHYEKSEQLTKHIIKDIIHIHNKKYKIISEKLEVVIPDYTYEIYTQNKKQYINIKHKINSCLQKNEIIEHLNFNDVNSIDKKYNIELIKSKIEEEINNIETLELFYKDKTLLKLNQPFSSNRKYFGTDIFITQYFLTHKKHIVKIDYYHAIKLGLNPDCFIETEDADYFNQHISPYLFIDNNIVLKLEDYGEYFVFSKNGLLLCITDSKHSKMFKSAYSKLAELNLPASTMNGKLLTLILGHLSGHKKATAKLNLFKI